jgi:hypothetical protein
VSIRENTCFPNVFSGLYNLFNFVVIYFEYKPIDDKLSTLWTLNSTA